MSRPTCCKLECPKSARPFHFFVFFYPSSIFFLGFARKIAKVTLSGQIPRLGSKSQYPIIRVYIPRYWDKSQGMVTLQAATADGSDTLRQGHRSRGGSGGSCPLSLKPWGRCPPTLSSDNVFSFHHSYNLYKDVLCRHHSQQL